MKTTIAITADFVVELPLLPNFIKLESGQTIDVKDIHTASLVAIADQWKQALLVHAGDRRKNITPSRG